MNKLDVEENCSSICFGRYYCINNREGAKQYTSNMDLCCINHQGAQIQQLRQQKDQSTRIPRQIREQLQEMIKSKVIQEFKFKDLEFSENDLIGKGGFGKVYKCKIKFQNGQQLVAALKIIETDNQASKLKVMRRFLEEVKIHASIRHDNIMLLQGISFDVKLCLIMPLMQLSLQDIIDQKGKTLKQIRKEKSLKFLLQIAKGMQWLHAQGIIHRDLKPNNILIDQFYNAKLSDLGLAVLQDYLGQHQ